MHTLHHKSPPARTEERARVDPNDHRIVVTGMGVVTPLGSHLALFWQQLITGQSGISHIRLCDPGDSPSRIAGQVPDFDPHAYMERREARRTSRVCQFAIAAAEMAITDAQLGLDTLNRDMAGIVFANTSGAPPEDEQSVQRVIERGVARLNNPYYLTGTLPNMSASAIAVRFGLTGYNVTIATACAASTQAIGEAAEVIRRGDAKIMLAGGAEAPISPISLAGFHAIRALSTDHVHPSTASRPFDVTRNGFVLSEGAAVLVLEQLSHARSRNAPIYAELIGYGTSCDAYHATAPHPEGHGAILSMQRALSKANITPRHVDYINAHATSTQPGDLSETRAIKEVFGPYAYTVPISAIKSMIGHSTSAAGGIEAVATIMTLKNGIIPPTINYEYPDPQCNLDYVPNEARRADVRIAISNSFAFGGINATLVFQQIAPKNEHPLFQVHV